MGLFTRASWAIVLLALALACAGCITNQVRPPGGGGGGGGGGQSTEPQDTTISVTSSPAGAAILLNGQATGRATPGMVDSVSSEILGTTSVIGLSLAGYHAYNALVTTYADRETTDVDVTLVPNTVANGSATITSDPAGAAILVDGVNTGEVTPADLADLTSTSHAINLRLSGYRDRLEAFTVPSGGNTEVHLDLVQLETDALGGTVYDGSDASLVIGATVQIVGTSFQTTTTQYGSYLFENVPAGTYEITATKTLADSTQLVGRRVDAVLGGAEDRQTSVNILMAREGQTAAIAGEVTDMSSRAIRGAAVWALLYVGDWPVASHGARTNSQGRYTIPGLPPGTYDVICTADDRENAAVSQEAIAAGATEALDFRLADIRRNPAAVETPFLDGDPQAITYPRAENVRASAYLAVREQLARSAGLPEDSPRMRMFGQLRRERERVGARGFPPAGHHIEVDVFWLAAGNVDLAGYSVNRSTDRNLGFRRAVLIEDPSATFAADISPFLGAGTRYYYDLYAFVTDGTEGSTSEPGSTTPLDRVVVTAPAEGATVGATPTFTWGPLARAAVYRVFVYDQVPDFDTASAETVWSSADLPAGNTSVVYGTTGQAAALVDGQTYYWVLVAWDDTDTAFATALSISPIHSFIVDTAL